MQERATLEVQKEIWKRFRNLADQRQVNTTTLIEEVLLTYLNNEEKAGGAECNINWLGFGSVKAC